MSDSWKKDTRGIHRLIAGESSLSGRMRRIAEAWVGRPYVSDSLIGGPDQREKLVVNLGAFDCVTFIESTLALARSRSPTGFIGQLRKIRYRDGRVDWRARLHYFSDWMKYNHSQGVILIRTRGPGSRQIETGLAFLEGLAPRRTRLRVVPKRKIHLARERISDGSVIAFASLRSRLDFFHTGLLFFQGDEIRLCHASRSAGKVISEPLDDFLNGNRMRGIAFAVPREAGDNR